MLVLSPALRHDVVLAESLRRDHGQDDYDALVNFDVQRYPVVQR